VEGLVALLNLGVHPIVPALGSLGASDLAPNAAVAQVLLGHGEAEYDGARLPAIAALAAAGLQPLRLGSKDGLALISANSLTLGQGALVLAEAARLIPAFDAAAALTFEGFGANLSILHPAVQAARPQPGQTRTAESLRTLLEGSALWESGAARNTSPSLLPVPLARR
jgi:histidine ammonia-lyase